MKRIFKSFVVFVLLLNIMTPIRAIQNSAFYVYSSNTSEFDEYAQEKLDIHIYTFYGNVDNTLKLGKGIQVYGDISNPLVVYPIWKNNEIVATFKVVYSNGVFSGSYSEGNATQLNFAKDITTKNNPLKLFVYENQFLYSVGNTVYDATSGEGLIVSDVNIYELKLENETIIDVSNTLEYQNIKNSKAADSWNLYWTTPEHNPSNLYSCYAYCLSALLKCSGYSEYTVSEVKNRVAQANGSSIHLAAASLVNLKNFLDNEGFDYDASSSENGSLSSSQVVSIIYNNKKYILTGLYNTNGNATTPKHMGVITGYTLFYGEYTYNMYDPQDKSPGGKVTVDASTRTYTNSEGRTYVWNQGYVYNITR